MPIFGNRIPVEFFVSSGKGQSNVGSEGLPYETGSYDEALFRAGIENANIVLYTSVIPTQAKQISREAGIKTIKFGNVMECIMAQKNGHKGETISAAVITTSITDPSGKYLGGFACEYAGSGSKEQASHSLLESIEGMIERRLYGVVAGGMKMAIDNKTDKGYIIHRSKNPSNL